MFFINWDHTYSSIYGPCISSKWLGDLFVPTGPVPALANYGLWAESSPPHFVKTVLREPSYVHFVRLVSGRFPATRAGLSSPNKDLTSYKAQQTSYQFLYRKFHQSLICPVLISISPIFQLINHILMNI